MSSAAEDLKKDTRDQVAALGEKYKYGFVTDIEMERAPRGLSEDTVRYISAKKNEPDWMLEWRLGAFRRWLEMKEPDWARVHYPKIDYQNSYYYAAPKNTPLKQSLDEVDPSCWKPTRSWASRCMSRWRWPGWRWMRCSIPCRWPPPSRTNSTNRA